jgi:ATP-binding cassette, subfamily B, bacterial MsbA
VDDEVFSDKAKLEQVDDGLEKDGLTTRDMLSRIVLIYLKPRMKLLGLSLLAMLVVAATTGLMPVLVKQAIDAFLDDSTKAIPMWIPWAIIAVTAFKALNDFFVRVTRSYLSFRTVADIQIDLFSKLMITDLAELSQTHSGRFVSSFLNDAVRIRETVNMMVAFVKNSLIVAATLVAMYWIEWRLALIATVILPVMLYFMAKQRRTMRKSTRASLQETGELSTIISEALSGIRVVKACQQEQFESEQAAVAINRNVKFLMRGARARAASAPIAEALSGVAIAAIIAFAGYQISFGVISAGDFAGFMVAVPLLYQPLKALASTQTALQEGVAAAARIFSLLDRRTNIVDAENATVLTVTKGEIVFDNVSFSYRDGTPVLRNFSLTIPAGKRVALVGPSGAGKSTVLNLVLRFFEAQSGVVNIDGQDITKATLWSLRQATALVTQDPFLFDDTIAANIAYGCLKVSPAQIKQAARQAGAHNFITALPEGYDTRVGEVGRLISGGEKQRLVIARALLRDTPILLLDEATSSLDAQAEERVQSILDGLDNDRTVLTIAHRLSSVRNADIICVMDKGTIVERGSHDELLAHGGLYKDLYTTQFADVEKMPNQPPSPVVASTET